MNSVALPAARSVDVLAYGVMRIPHLRAFLPEARNLSFRLRPNSATDAIAGWGYRPTADRARRLAAQRSIPYWALEDGFLRSAGLGSTGAPPISLIADDKGIYFDATRPSRLEQLLNGGDPIDEATLSAGRDLIAFKNQHNLSKYNAAVPFDPTSLPSAAGRARVLVIDQTAGDASIEFGMADAGSFQAMLDAAIAENPKAQIIVKRHPAVAAGYRQGLVDPARHPGIVTMDMPCNPVELLKQVDKVYTVSSLLGFEAMLLGLPVHCFGMPFYAGWGATTDRLQCERRTQTRSVQEIAAAALIGYARYVDPLTGEACSAMRGAERLLTFKQRTDSNRGHWPVTGIAFWKRLPIRRQLEGPESTVSFHRSLDGAVRRGGNIAIWSARERPRHGPLMAEYRVERIEDGFIRSAGLGSDFHGAASIALDDTGIYYDPASNSRLERILSEAAFPEELLSRAETLRRALIEGKVTKYNIGENSPLHTPTGKPVLLVVGQVEGDASIERGCPEISTNDGLVAAVRRTRPNAFLIYKEHPDVASGNRKGSLSAISEGQIDGRADGLSIDTAIAGAAEIHTMTSLAGFEALLRDKPVFTYGQPFYAGWGLTTDACPVDHRTRRISLAMLIAGALILYPRYVDPISGLPCEAEFVVWRLSQLANKQAGAVDGIRSPRRYARALSYGWNSLFHRVRY